MSTEAAILDAAAAVLEARGLRGLTTRVVCEAAGIRSPTLYHHFGDKDGLERALLQRGLADFMQRKRRASPSEDPLDQLRDGWNVALEFALKRPAFYALLLHHVREQPELVADAYEQMRSRVQRLVDMGRFMGPVDTTARVIWAASQGALSLVQQGVPRKEVEVVSGLLFEAVVTKLSCPVR